MLTVAIILLTLLRYGRGVYIVLYMQISFFSYLRIKSTVVSNPGRNMKYVDSVSPFDPLSSC